ncbi:MAG: hypothetical protein ACXVPN_03895 [Bacteroidia bacterium]
MKTKILLILSTIGTLLSCSDVKRKTVKIKSFELSPVNGKDTINVVDSKGRKQGIWLTTKTANSVSYTDTLYYKDDSLVKK